MSCKVIQHHIVYKLYRISTEQVNSQQSMQTTTVLLQSKNFVKIGKNQWPLQSNLVKYSVAPIGANKHHMSSTCYNIHILLVIVLCINVCIMDRLYLQTGSISIMKFGRQLQAAITAE